MCRRDYVQVTGLNPVFLFPVYSGLTYAHQVYLCTGRAHHSAPQGHGKGGLAPRKSAIAPIQTDAPGPRAIKDPCRRDRPDSTNF